MAAALHALALTESAPALVLCYPPNSTTMEQFRAVVLSVVRERQSFIRVFLSSAPQTNEVGRSGVLVGGFMQVAKETGLPLRVLEIGQRRPQRQLGSVFLSTRRCRLGRPKERCAHRADLGRTVAAD
jgi:hypothetical protein